MIEISGLYLQHDGQQILKDIDAQIPASGLTAVIGPNGAGKSSLLHCLAGLVAPSEGSIRVNGIDIIAARAEERARVVALLPQGTSSLPRLTVADLVAFGRWPHHRGRPGPQDHEIVAASLRVFDLEALADRRLDTLSGGQRQRAFVAMAYAQSTPWILLDEPLSALDPKYAIDIMRRIHALSRPGADIRGPVVVLHDLGMAARYADWILCLKDGHLFKSAPRAEVVTSNTLSELFDTAITVEQVKGCPVVIVE
ncbi:ABC transporter ATP-binding protein [Paracoccus tegillarcae]|uniref:ABC transporter ATP-binding protein n=1 Tax=Paracoccus tegillarcae TaxID=1529068 RepID=A0A2K9ECB2_9RHOB|nr:ABC transporter ATP-binding protein [Paracoccus tegillarcae]AUH32563.1 ABC transporter ATP-binding protein [Paracoccus tegillarcae]